ncbi:unnamed protein product [Schistosoma mattheei]|uniref:Uncharacterized protein n=1 Tax=Schistosoma mattheei TaxID=31246 RepID=A0A183PLQ6_9TREM|nr:unnamed protein product [Schistosoma mattheei]
MELVIKHQLHKRFGLHRRTSPPLISYTRTNADEDN